MASTSVVRTIRLEPIAGPAVESITVPSDKPFVIGRQNTCDGLLTDNTVSRRHALITHRAETWFISDLQSYHGTYLNGVRLNGDEPSPIRPGDLIRIGPWTMRVGGPPRGAHLLSTTDDMASTVHRVQRVPAKDLSLRAQHRLDLLLDCAASISASTSEQQLAEAVLAALASGTGFPRAAFIRRPTTSDLPTGTVSGTAGYGGQIEVIAFRGPDTRSRTPGGSSEGESQPMRTENAPAFSRSLIQAASQGEIVRLEENSAPQYGQSVVQLGIQAAICAPVMLDGAPAAYLYLDARRSESRGGSPVGHALAPVIEPDAPAFCQAIARICGLALANLNRRELAVRQDQLVADLNAAREAQRLIMPKPAGTFGPVQYALRSKPGRFIAGDLFDLFPFPDGRIGIFLGDVSGKGIEAAMLMATAQAHLHASLHHTGDPAAAVIEVNRHIAPRIKDGKFITLWAGIIDPAARTLTYVDAGHGHCMIKPGTGDAERLGSTGGLPIGISAEAEYPPDTATIPPGGRLILYSDGLVEQQSPAGEEFGLSRAISALAGASAPEHDVVALFDALLAFATPEPAQGAKATPPDRISLADDVTIASLLIG